MTSTNYKLTNILNTDINVRSHESVHWLGN